MKNSTDVFKYKRLICVVNDEASFKLVAINISYDSMKNGS